MHSHSDKPPGTFEQVIPGKEEFYETIRYFKTMLSKLGVTIKLNTRVEASDLVEQGFDSVIIATGVSPRTPPIPGVDHPKVLSYIDLLRNKAEVGKKVAVIGAGGIGFDVAEFLVHPKSDKTSGDEVDLDEYLKEWGVDKSNEVRSGLLEPKVHPAEREITLLQRKSGKVRIGEGYLCFPPFLLSYVILTRRYAPRHSSAPGSARPPAGSTAPTS